MSRNGFITGFKEIISIINMNKLRDCYGVIKRLKISSFLDNKYFAILMIISVLLTISSTFYVVKVSDSITELTKNFKKDSFKLTVGDFFIVSLIAMIRKYLSMCVVTFTLQEICRRNFASCIKDCLEMKYNQFHKRSPGEWKYIIFLCVFNNF